MCPNAKRVVFGNYRLDMNNTTKFERADIFALTERE
jgi:hypothetical protein